MTWLTAFLHNRSQCVAIKNVYTGISQVISGVPHGSLLDPALFLVYINVIDAIYCGNSQKKLFADDFKIYTLLASVILRLLFSGL